MVHSSQLFIENNLYYKNANHYITGESDVWLEEPNYPGIIIYSYITPLISMFGICFNIICLIVLIRQEFKASIYTYLLVLAVTDLINSAILFVSGLCRGVLWWTEGWREYEALISLPLGGAISCISVTATVAVALDRVVYLWNPTRCHKPKFCQRQTARIIMFVGVCISILFNIPYCFIYQWKPDGTLETSDFFDSTFYSVHNWTKFAIFGLLSAIILIIGNGFLIYTLKQALMLKAQCQTNCNVIKKKFKKKKDQRLVTITLISIVFLFLIGEFPTHLASRKTAVTILFLGDQARADESKALETFRQIATMLNAIDIAANFIVYALFCPQFVKALKKTFARQKKIVKPNTVQVNVFVLNGNGSNLKLPTNPKNIDKFLEMLQLQNASLKAF